MHDIEQVVDRQGAKLDRLEYDFNTFASRTGETLSQISATLSRLEATKPQGFPQIIQSIIALFVLIGSTVGGITYIATAITEPRVALMEYKLGVQGDALKNMHDDLYNNRWQTTVTKTP